MVSDGELAEWAEVHGELYGTLKAELDSAAERGEHVVLDIDVQGARQIRQSVPEAVLVFLLPPSVEVLLQRLRGRGTEEKVQVARRLQTAMDELQAAGEFDHVVVNDDFDRCLGSIRGIVESEALRSTRAPGLEDTVEEMRDRLGSVLQSDSVNATR
jgi:guanylate kinase